MNFNTMHATAKPFNFNGELDGLKELVERPFDEENGTLMQSNDNFGRRVLVLVGNETNIVVLDRYPDVPTTMYLVHAIPEVLEKLPPVLRNENMSTLTSIVKGL